MGLELGVYEELPLVLLLSASPADLSFQPQCLRGLYPLTFSKQGHAREASPHEQPWLGRGTGPV